MCAKNGLKSRAQEKSDEFQLNRWNKKRSATEMAKLYAEGQKDQEKLTESKERRSRAEETSNEPTKEGRHPNEPKSDEEDVQIIEIKKEPKSADTNGKNVESVVREKSIPSENISQKANESAKFGETKRTSSKVESVRDNNKKALNYVKDSQERTKEQFKDDKTDACMKIKKTCVRNNVKNIDEQSKDKKVQQSANEQFKDTKSKSEAIELRASDQIEIIQCEPNSNCDITPKINFLNKLNLVTSTPINGNLNKTYTIQKQVNLKQDLLNAIKDYQKLAISQLNY